MLASRSNALNYCSRQQLTSNEKLSHQIQECFESMFQKTMDKAELLDTWYKNELIAHHVTEVTEEEVCVFSAK